MIWNADTTMQKIKVIIGWVATRDVEKFSAHARWVVYDYNGKQYPAILFPAALGTVEEADQQLDALKATGRFVTAVDK